MIDVGYFSLVIALILSAYSAIVSVLGARKQRGELIASGENGIFAVFGLLTIAVMVLLYAFVARDFQVKYVAEYSSRDLPMFYTVSALWAGQEGSLLLWGWLLSLFTSLAIYQNQKKNRGLMPYVSSVLMIINSFFLVLMVFVTNPFQRLDFMPPDGQGLNPLLQNPGMIFHPTTLYLGYVGFAIPYAFAMAALITGRLGDNWIRSTRKWTIFSWLFLGLGNLLGAQWAYVELGWGGYWAWDPVENASFMPWLIGTAFLHSVMIQERKDMMKVWNIFLIILTFLLTIFGTFITRSGLISSVHSFGKSSLGPFFLGFLFFIVIVSFGLMIYRLDSLKSKNELDSIISRESSFLFNNLILVSATFAIFWGTIFPMISEAIRGVKITVGPPFFNQVNIPIGLALLFITGVCPLIAWKKASAKNLKRNFLYPFFTALAAGGALFYFGIRGFYPLTSFILAVFVTATILFEFIRGTRARRDLANENLFRAFFSLIWKNKRRYGGYIIHMGMVLIFVGITGSAFKSEKEVVLKRGDTLQFNKYRIRYDNFVSYPAKNKEVVAATLTLFNSGKEIGKLSPEKNFHKNQEQPTTEVAILSTLKEDLYVILMGWDKNQAATFKFLINPLVMWIWLGGGVLILGTILAIWPDKREEERRAKYI